MFKLKQRVKKCFKYIINGSKTENGSKDLT